MSEQKANDKSVIKNIGHIESRQTKFRRKFKQLDDTEKKILEDWVGSSEEDLSLVKIELSTLKVPRQKRVLDTLIDYFEFRYRSETDDSLVSRKNAVLKTRFGLSTGSNEQWKSGIGVMPHLGQAPSMLRTSVFNNSYFGQGAIIQARPAYYDFLSMSAGHLPNSQLSMMDLSFRFFEDQIKLNSLDLLNIETLNISPSNLPEDGGLAWKLRAGIERNYLSAQADSNEWFLESGIGKASEFDALTLYAMTEVIDIDDDIK